MPASVRELPKGVGILLDSVFEGGGEAGVAEGVAIGSAVRARSVFCGALFRRDGFAGAAAFFGAGFFTGCGFAGFFAAAFFAAGFFAVAFFAVAFFAAAFFAAAFFALVRFAATFSAGGLRPGSRFAGPFTAGAFFAGALRVVRGVVLPARLRADDEGRVGDMAGSLDGCSARLHHRYGDGTVQHVSPSPRHRWHDRTMPVENPSR